MGWMRGYEGLVGKDDASQGASGLCRVGSDVYSGRGRTVLYSCCVWRGTATELSARARTRAMMRKTGRPNKSGAFLPISATPSIESTRFQLRGGPDRMFASRRTRPL